MVIDLFEDMSYMVGLTCDYGNAPHMCSRSYNVHGATPVVDHLDPIVITSAV